MQSTVGAFEAKTHLSELLERVARGERITITKHGKPIAQLVPAVPLEKPDVKQVVAEMLAYRDRQNRTLGDITTRELVEEGRRY
jgi:prevent-host-death family protein